MPEIKMFDRSNSSPANLEAKVKDKFDANFVPETFFVPKSPPKVK